MKIKLTKSQQTAYDEYFSSMDVQDVAVISGPAGTGKTFLTSFFIKELISRGYTIISVSPTWAASIPLATATLGQRVSNDYPFTVASCFLIKKMKQGGKLIKKAYFPRKVKGLLTTKTLFLLDECSFYSIEEYEAVIRLQATHKFKILAVGDIEQLPSPDSGGDQISKWFQHPTYFLTEVVRQQGAVLQMATKIRNTKIPADKIIPKIALTTLFREKFTNDDGRTILAYTNDEVNHWNRVTRTHLGRSEQLEVGDLIVGYLGMKNKSINPKRPAALANSIFYTVTKIKKGYGSYWTISCESKILKDLRGKGINVRSNITFDLMPTGLNDNIILGTNDDWEKNKQIIKGKLKDLYDAKQAAFLTKKWLKYYEIQKETADFFVSRNTSVKLAYLPDDDKLIPYSELSWIQKRFVSKNSDLVLDKGAGYGYAVTIHKSQGATIDKVAVSLQIPNGKMKYNGDKPFKLEGNMLLYVASSRSPDTVFFL